MAPGSTRLPEAEALESADASKGDRHRVSITRLQRLAVLAEIREYHAELEARPVPHYVPLHAALEAYERMVQCGMGVER